MKQNAGTFAKIGATLGASLMVGAFLTGALVPHTGQDGEGHRVMLFERDGPCDTCGHAAVLPPCATEDSTAVPCLFDASVRGDGVGRSFWIDGFGRQHFIP